MNWEVLKDKVYYLDGSLHDIYILNTTKDDWQLWVDFVNENYKTAFYIYETETIENKIDFSIIVDYWEGKRESAAMATIYADNIIIKSYFFSDQEIENDITPTEFHSIDNHEQLMSYMKGISKATNKKVILTDKNSQEILLVSVEKDKITFGN